MDIASCVNCYVPHAVFIHPGKPISRVELHSGQIDLGIVQSLVVPIEFLPSKLDIKPDFLVR